MQFYLQLSIFTSMDELIRNHEAFTVLIPFLTDIKEVSPQAMYFFVCVSITTAWLVTFQW